jgi:hypothetical protein
MLLSIYGGLWWHVCPGSAMVCGGTCVQVQLWSVVARVSRFSYGLWWQVCPGSAMVCGGTCVQVQLWSVLARVSRFSYGSFSAPAPDNAERVWDAMLRSASNSTMWQELELRLNECSVCQFLHKDLHYHPYKTHFTLSIITTISSSVFFFVCSIFTAPIIVIPTIRLNSSWYEHKPESQLVKGTIVLTFVHFFVQTARTIKTLLKKKSIQNPSCPGT